MKGQLRPELVETVTTDEAGRFWFRTWVQGLYYLTVDMPDGGPSAFLALDGRTIDKLVLPVER